MKEYNADGSDVGDFEEDDLNEIFSNGFVVGLDNKDIKEYKEEEEEFKQSRRSDAFANRGGNTFRETVLNSQKEEPPRPEERITGERLRKIQKELQREQEGQFIIDLHHKGLPLNQEQIDLILDLGLITEEELTGVKKITISKEDESVPFDQRNNISGVFSRGNSGVYESTGEDIETSEWMPKSVIDHKPDFVSWINSVCNDGFQNQTDYKPLKKYIQQAHNWLAEKDYFDNYRTHDEKWEFFEREFKRCGENTLYFLDKYLYLKESDIEDASSMKYYAKPVHEVLLFMADSGYSMMIGKPRQIAATTTFLGFGLKKLMFNKNFFLKFVTMDVDTAEEIMDDKLKYPINELPAFIRPSVYGDSHEGLNFGRRIKGKKGLRGGANSKFHVVAPSVSAINAGAPPLVFVDEAGYIKVLGKMLREARPTMFRQDPKTGKLKMTRQVVIWSTGGVEEGKNRLKTKSFEEEVNHALEKWNEGSYDYGIVPIFFDWTTRPGITKEFYDNEKRNYSSGNESERDQRMNQFRLTYPSCWNDMFLTEQKLIIPISAIQENEDRINKAPIEYKPQPGYFEPIIDSTIQTGKGYTEEFGGKIVGARFIPVDYDDKSASAWIFMHPVKGWRNRYFKGTDPIMTDTGYSNMSSSILDVKLNTLAAIVDYRNENHKQTFLQCFLLGLYYNPDDYRDGVPELVEANIGTAYIDYVDSLGYYTTLVYKDELPDAFRGGGQTIGIDNKARRAEFIVSRMKEMLTLYQTRIYHLQVFQQLRTFACSMTASGATVWSVTDKRRYKDDVLYSMVFAYICSLCYTSRELKQLGGNEEKYVVKYETVRGPHGLTRRPVRRKAR